MPTHAHVFTDDAGVDRTQVSMLASAGGGLLIGGSVPTDPANIVRSRLLNGGSADLRVAGTLVAPVVFSYAALPSNDVVLYELRLMLTSANLKFDGVSFGNKVTLPNGVLVEVIVNDGQTGTLGTLKTHEDLLYFASNPGLGMPATNGTGPTDFAIASYNIGGAWKLKAGSGDVVRVSIRDDLDKRNLAHFQAEIRGVRI